MKLLMKKVGQPTSENITEESIEKTEDEQQPKKIRNRPLFHIKVSFCYIFSELLLTSVKSFARQLK